MLKKAKISLVALSLIGIGLVSMEKEAEACSSVSITCLYNPSSICVFGDIQMSGRALHVESCQEED